MSQTHQVVASEEAGAPAARPPRARSVGLSGKLVILTIFFVMLAEVLIYVPSIANFRVTWLKERLASAQIASLALEATPDLALSADLSRELLQNAGVLAVVLQRDSARELILQSQMPPPLDRRYDLRETMRLHFITDAFDTLFAPPGRVIGIVDDARNGNGREIEIVIDEQPLRDAMLRFSVNVLTLSIAISAITASLVYLALTFAMVRPMRRLTGSIVRFAENPEDRARVIVPSGRGDEIGRAENELSQMQHQLRSMLRQKGRLAELGLAVSKINHDLRNILAQAQLISDRLRAVRDPAVERLVPKLVASLDRAIELCSNTLKYGKAEEAAPVRRRFALAALVDEVAEMADIAASGAARFVNTVPAGLEIDADRDQLFRILHNLARNAVQAIEAAGPKYAGGEVRVSAERAGTIVTIVVADSGPGIAAKVLPHLFEAFRGSGSPGGIGLGLAIAAELTRLHGGEIRHDGSGRGAVFEVTIPDTVPQIAAHREAAR